MMNQAYKQLFILLACLVNLMLMPVMVFAADTDISISKDKQEVYQHKSALKRIAIADPSIASVTLLSPKSILITAKAEGATQISLWETTQPGQPSATINLIVNKSSEVEKSAFKVLGKESLDIKPAGNTLMVEGGVNSLEAHGQAVTALKQDPKAPIDATVSNFDSHVQIDIKVVEVSRKNMLRFGLFLGKNNQDNPTLAVGAPGTLSGVDGTFTLNSSSGFLPVLNAFNVVVGNKGSGLLGTLSILESNGFAYTLAEPSLSAISGQTANFLAGGEFPVPIKSGTGVDSSVTILYKEYGVRLMLTPVVLDSNRIFMKVSPEVSELDFANAVQTGGVSVPGLRVRRTDTSVSMGDGESFVISGMVSRNAINNVDQIPGLGNLPIIGPFFQSKRFDREDKELLMVVTPRLVRPISKDAKLPELPGKEYSDYKPSFSEFFFSNGPKPSTGMSN